MKILAEIIISDNFCQLHNKIKNRRTDDLKINVILPDLNCLSDLQLIFIRIQAIFVIGKYHCSDSIQSMVSSNQAGNSTS